MIKTILDQIQGEHFEIAPLKRALAKARKGFRAKSPNDVEHLTFLALLLSSIGEVEKGVSILEFVGGSVPVDDGSRMDLLSALAISRLALAFLYRKQRNRKLLQEVLSIEGLDDCENFETFDSDAYRNIVQEKLVRQTGWIAELADDEDATPADYLSTYYESFLDLIVLSEMVPTLQQKITNKDVNDLQDALRKNEELFKTQLLQSTKSN